MAVLVFIALRAASGGMWELLFVAMCGLLTVVASLGEHRLGSKQASVVTVPGL